MSFDNLMHECGPILKNEDLLALVDSSIAWTSIAKPLSKRCPAQKLDTDFPHIRKHVPFINENEATRPKVLVCHDVAANYGDDR